jgi:archaellum component FlaC
MFNYEISDDEIQNLKHHFEDYIINLRIKKYNLDFGDRCLPIKMEPKQTVFMQEEVNLIEKEIRSTANFLKSLSKEFNKLKSEIVVPDFSEKNESEITSFYDAIVSAAEYYKYSVKKIICLTTR